MSVRFNFAEGISRRPVTSTEQRTIRPDVVTEIGQLIAGQAVISFDVYTDLHGQVNSHRGRLAVIRGDAMRIKTGEIVDRGPALGKYVEVWRLPADTRPEPSNMPKSEWLKLGNLGISGVDDTESPHPTSGGLLLVTDYPDPSRVDLRVGQGLYVDGDNRYAALDGGRRAFVTLDSNPRLLPVTSALINPDGTVQTGLDIPADVWTAAWDARDNPDGTA